MRQLLFVSAFAACSTFALQTAAQNVVNEAAGADVDVERIPATTVVVNDAGDEQRAFSAAFLCGRIDSGGETVVGATDRERTDRIGVGFGDQGGRVGVGSGEPAGRIELRFGSGENRIGNIGSPRDADVLDPGFIDDGARGARLPPGIYRTAINILNLNAVEAGAAITTVLTLPVRDTAFGGAVEAQLAARSATEIDCVDILRLLDGGSLGSGVASTDLDFLDANFIGGFVVLETEALGLDVTAIYTFRPLLSGRFG